MSLWDPTSDGGPGAYVRPRRSLGDRAENVFLYGWCFIMPLIVAIATIIQWLF